MVCRLVCLHVSLTADMLFSFYSTLEILHVLSVRAFTVLFLVDIID